MLGMMFVYLGDNVRICWGWLRQHWYIDLWGNVACQPYWEPLTSQLPSSSGATLVTVSCLCKRGRLTIQHVYAPSSSIINVCKVCRLVSWVEIFLYEGVGPDEERVIEGIGLLGLLSRNASSAYCYLVPLFSECTCGRHLPFSRP